MTGRREFLLSCLAAGLLVSAQRSLAGRHDSAPIMRPIPASGERLPAIGMGSWQTFDESLDGEVRERLRRVLEIFFERGGRLIDSSPMYGRSETVIGELLGDLGRPGERAFLATKVWTRGRQSGLQQMRRSADRLGATTIDLMQIHNLLDWRTHYDSLVDLKASGRIRYIGITTSHGRSHSELEQALRGRAFDFVQLTYSVRNRSVEERLLPLARDRGIAVLVNRPFEGGSLFQTLRGKRLPDWVADFDCQSWGQVLLKFVISHPAVSCAIPATSKPGHMQDNMGALYGRLPDDMQRARVVRLLESI